MMLTQVTIDADDPSFSVVEPQEGYRWYHLCHPSEPPAPTVADVQDRLRFAVDAAADVVRVQYSGRLLDPGIASWVVYLTWLLLDDGADHVGSPLSSIQGLPWRAGPTGADGRRAVTEQLAEREPHDPDGPIPRIRVSRLGESAPIPRVTLIDWLELAERAFALRDSFRDPAAPDERHSSSPEISDPRLRQATAGQRGTRSARKPRGPGRPPEFDPDQDAGLVADYEKSGKRPADFAKDRGITKDELTSAQARVRARKPAKKSDRPQAN